MGPLSRGYGIYFYMYIIIILACLWGDHFSEERVKILNA